MSKITKIEINQDCIGCGTCGVIASKTFSLNSEGKSTIAKPAGDTDEVILQASQSCPVLAIHLFDEAGKQLYP
ncbi:ferredoxin [Candidatus Parcubacteria bacterium]|nr:ferredoxin [Patescibacteria group bacterium]MBU4381093.1 ferredoxin [Patescibacteria group bacterium]MCG2689184.1 ferredoxin [Candidatus Parcubacteria bacterium]